LMVIEKKANGKIEARTVLSVSFVPLVGSSHAETAGKGSDLGHRHYE
jgi:hypothetical protein